MSQIFMGFWAQISPYPIHLYITHFTNCFHSQMPWEKSLCSPSLHPDFHPDICFLGSLFSHVFWDITPLSIRSSLQTSSSPSSCSLCLLSSAWSLQVNNSLELCPRFSPFLRPPRGSMEKSSLHSPKYKWLLNLYLQSRSLFYYQSPCI